MRFKFTRSSLAVFLFLGVFLKCMSPFLHAHIAGDNDSGFHMSGLSAFDNARLLDDGSPEPTPDSYAVTVPDARKHFLDTTFAVAFVAVVLLVLKDRPFIRRVSFAKTLLVPFSFLNPKFPPPALAPPQRHFI
ncbi:hypothetical protein [Polynucleobacter sp. HIN5]|uniref:hypothetical protein n=1 Tax=Polynucleobacter sp. HIN5 TaxID=3047864 RepID=UPI002573CC3E|nr:hypothetical protein [Polynucleobacter sp. HIN5]